MTHYPRPAFADTLAIYFHSIVDNCFHCQLANTSVAICYSKEVNVQKVQLFLSQCFETVVNAPEIATRLGLLRFQHPRNTENSDRKVSKRARQ